METALEMWERTRRERREAWVRALAYAKWGDALQKSLEYLYDTCEEDWITDHIRDTLLEAQELFKVCKESSPDIHVFTTEELEKHDAEVAKTSLLNIAATKALNIHTSGTIH